MGNQFSVSSDIGVGLPPGSFVADDQAALDGVAHMTRGNPTDDEIAIVTAVLLGLRTTMVQESNSDNEITAWAAAAKAEHLYQSPFISAADPRLNARSNRAWFARR